MALRLPAVRLRVRTALGLVVAVALVLAVWNTFFSPTRRWRRAIRDDNDGIVRWAAVSDGLGGRVPGMDAEAVVGELIAALRDPSFRVRQTSAAVLGRLGTEAKAAVPALVRALGDEHAWVRSSAAGSLMLIVARDDPARDDIIPALVAALDDRNPAVRLAAACTLAHLGEHDAARPVLIEALGREDAMARMQAIWSLRAMGLKAEPAVPALLAIVRGPSATAGEDMMRLRRVEAAELLAILGEVRIARRVLRDSSSDPSPIVRQESNRILRALPTELREESDTTR